MAIEALALTSEPYIGLTPKISAPQSELPFHYRFDVLQKILQEEGRIPEELWNGRGNAVEKKVEETLSEQPQVISISTIKLNESSTEWSDLETTTQSLNGLDPITIKVEVKSSSMGINEYKRKIRNKILGDEIREQMIGPLNQEAWKVEWKEKIDRWNQQDLAKREKIISRWLTNHKIILVNGGNKNGVEKKKLEIFAESIYPQLKRIVISELERKGEVPVFPQPYELITLPIKRR